MSAWQKGRMIGRIRYLILHTFINIACGLRRFKRQGKWDYAASVIARSRRLSSIRTYHGAASNSRRPRLFFTHSCIFKV
jgi:hypothetical protein